MIRPVINIRFFISLVIFLFLVSGSTAFAQNHTITLTIHLRGVHESKISLMTMSASRIIKPIEEQQGIQNGGTCRFLVPPEKLPGEFVLRFDYKETESSTPYPSEKYFFICDQELELWANPKYCNNADSTYFQKGERENSAFKEFTKENGRHREKLSLLQNFLMNYDDTDSKLYQQGIKEYEQRRKTYNQWLLTRSHQDKSLFVSKMYGFQYIPEVPWKGTDADRIKSLIYHYFDRMDFRDSLLIKTSNINKWMDSYVNLYGQLSTTIDLRDSLFSEAGRTAIEKAKRGHPLVYGWMVDYFYRGYETNSISTGMKVLEPYMNDPRCLTAKRQEIARRLKGMETLTTGTTAPNITLQDIYGKLFELNNHFTPNKYCLLLFWSADCNHCAELVNKLYPWQHQQDSMHKIQVIAISLDETETEIKAWKKKAQELKGWIHLLAEEGVRSKVAEDYFVLATPVMVLLETATKKIILLPNTLSELMKIIQ